MITIEVMKVKEEKRGLEKGLVDECGKEMDIKDD